MTKRIQIVDDDAHIRDVIRFTLEEAGFETADASNGIQALAYLQKSSVDLIILDVGMPELDGFQTCKEIRKSSDVPILFLTARNDEIDRVLAFELGGDDYLSKPFSPRELLLRAKAILKRGKPLTDSKVSVGHLTLDAEKHLATINGKLLTLTAREFRMLSTLAKHPDQVFPKARLMAQIYGETIFVADRTLDSHVRNLRAKARQLGCQDIITTVHGVGLKLGTCLC